MIWGWLHRHPHVVDVALVALLLFVGTGAAIRNGQHEPTAVVLGVAATLPLLVRRRYPREVVLIVAGVVLAMVALDVWTLPFQLAVALYTLMATRQETSERFVAVAATAAVAIAVLSSGLQFGGGAARIVFLIAAALLGDSIGSRRAYVHEVEEKAARLERERESETQRATAEEQARIARELHDVIAHALSVIVVQAGAADDAFEFDSERAREPVKAIDTAARAALADLRRVLGVLHESAEYAPQPGLAQMDELIEQVRATGLNVTLEVEGAAKPLPATVDLSAYRIVQEALTNTLKHADAEHVRVRIHYGERLELEVGDDGRGPEGAAVPGRGLLGMRERVSLLGGMLTTGARPGGGYRVAAEIPIEAA